MFRTSSCVCFAVAATAFDGSGLSYLHRQLGVSGERAKKKEEKRVDFVPLKGVGIYCVTFITLNIRCELCENVDSAFHALPLFWSSF